MNNKTIKITQSNDKINTNISGEVSFPDLTLMLFSALQGMALKTIDQVVERINPPAEHREALRTDVASDIADMINFAASNVLEKLSPKDPDLELTEIAIATMENQIIHKAAEEGKTIKEALKEYQEELLKSPYVATPSAPPIPLTPTPPASV